MSPSEPHSLPFGFLRECSSTSVSYTPPFEESHGTFYCRTKKNDEVIKMPIKSYEDTESTES